MCFRPFFKKRHPGIVADEEISRLKENAGVSRRFLYSVGAVGESGIGGVPGSGIGGIGGIGGFGSSAIIIYLGC
ncbi:hypothetical protein COU18_03170 [Candidatus Kaiserbacteria bacterium CG10_big_fil_rev_8_21_14_0_10_51_14]|uniref:Uncharacterized protein n=1 Tax=Candidatus Kaiserbacteria bacterium CG10_big_fil_rev_8_21_14_0_10_51_14 TaxID=1974610 RepID=A0A2H0UB92_9BACT|nr:MAG: hypothetical protein COU18_03170 [Candidatus Kaiserbacteria bacterium CG10_big_fil_rev_8_21_14_0_10_51_14]